MNDEFRSAALDVGRHRVEDLTSGEPTLDSWLRDQAATAEGRRVARTFVWTDESTRVVASYTLTGHVLVRDAVPRSVGRGMPVEIPVVLLARLALDQSMQGRHLGGVLLADALMRAVLATHQVAARYVVVDALHEKAASFYEHHGFRRLPDSLRLVQKVADIEAALGPH